MPKTHLYKQWPGTLGKTVSLLQEGRSLINSSDYGISTNKTVIKKRTVSLSMPFGVSKASLLSPGMTSQLETSSVPKSCPLMPLWMTYIAQMTIKWRSGR